MITVTIATPRFMPRRSNHRTSGSRPSVMNAAASTENTTLEMLANAAVSASATTTPSVATNAHWNGRLAMKSAARFGRVRVVSSASRARRSMRFTASV